MRQCNIRQNKIITLLFIALQKIYVSWSKILPILKLVII